MSELVSLTYDGEVAIVTIDNPPVNALSPVVMQAIGASIERAGRDEGVKSVVLIGNGPRLTGGADIHEFEKVTSGQRERGEGWYALFKRVEDCPRPVICAIHGTTLGGGVERIRDHRLSLYKKHGQAEDCRIELFDCAHDELPEMRTRCLEWLDRHLVGTQRRCGPVRLQWLCREAGVRPRLGGPAVTTPLVAEGRGVGDVDLAVAIDID